MFIFLFTVVGLFLRLINIIKPEGLWNDEYVSWYTANIPFNDGFFAAILKQCHMPLYYLYLKPWVGCSDTILRLTSVLPSIATIPVMYLAGKEFSKKNGYIAASITAALSFLVYYAQEVRFYSLLFLFSAMSLLFLIRLVKRGKGLAGYIVSSILILFTHVLGGIYVFYTTCYLLYKKQISKKIIFALIGTFLVILPIGLNILRMLPSSQWWGIFSYTNVMFLFTDFLSPILTNNVNAPPVFFYSKNIILNILLIGPTIIGIFGITSGTKKAKGIGLIVLLTLISMITLALLGKIVFITKYSIEILPAIILLMALGFNKTLATIFIAFHLIAVFTPFYPAKMYRSEGHKLVCEILNKEKAETVIYTYYEPERFERYLTINPKSLYISKLNRFDYVENPGKIFEHIKSGEKISVVFLDSVSFIPEGIIEQAKSRNFPEMFITFSIVKNELIKGLDNEFKDFSIKTNGSWTVITATKI